MPKEGPPADPLRPRGDGYRSSPRRRGAAQRARLHSIPAIVREIDDAATAEIALIENIQREDLNAIEEADGYRQLIDKHGHSAEDVGRFVHKSRSHVANLLRLLVLPAFVRDALASATRRPARAVATAINPEALAKETSPRPVVRQTESRARREKKPPGGCSNRAPRRPRPPGLERSWHLPGPVGRSQRAAGT